MQGYSNSIIAFSFITWNNAKKEKSSLNYSVSLKDSLYKKGSINADSFPLHRFLKQWVGFLASSKGSQRVIF